MSQKASKFVDPPRNLFDRHFQKQVRLKLNALLNGQIQDERGNIIGTIDYAAGNTLFKLTSGAGSAVSAFAITELGHRDYFLAAQLSNMRLVGSVPTADVSATDTKIAKARIVRRSILSELLFGDTVTYSDDDVADIDNTRNADKGSGPERQVCLPPYIILTDLGFTDTVAMNAQCIIYAKKIPGLTGVFDDDGNAIDWMEDTAGVRAFAERNGT